MENTNTFWYKILKMLKEQKLNKTLGKKKTDVILTQ